MEVATVEITVTSMAWPKKKKKRGGAGRGREEVDIIKTQKLEGEGLQEWDSGLGEVATFGSCWCF